MRHTVRNLSPLDHKCRNRLAVRRRLARPGQPQRRRTHTTADPHPQMEFIQLQAKLDLTRYIPRHHLPTMALDRPPRSRSVIGPRLPRDPLSHLTPHCPRRAMTRSSCSLCFAPQTPPTLVRSRNMSSDRLLSTETIPHSIRGR